VIKFWLNRHWWEYELIFLGPAALSILALSLATWRTRRITRRLRAQSLELQREAREWARRRNEPT
jgi:hypothetical protein